MLAWFYVFLNAIMKLVDLRRQEQIGWQRKRAAP